METPFDAIILGAGMSGLTLASRLRRQNKSFVILEKSAGVGGRLATRRGPDCTFDHGAQFIKNRLGDEAILRKTFGTENLGQVWFSQNDCDYIVFPKGMTQLPKSVMRPEELRLNEKVVLLESGQDLCTVHCESGVRYTAKKVYLTCPLPQTVALLKNSRISFPAELENIEYASALVGLFRVHSESSRIVNFSYQQDYSGNIFSISNQLAKGVSQNLAFTVVMQPSWSKDHFEKDDAKTEQAIAQIFTQALRDIGAGESFTIVSSQLKKWRYSHPLTIAQTPFQILPTDSKICLLGDAFGGGNIHGALRSALAVPLKS